jgi:hypothetical protein
MPPAVIYFESDAQIQTYHQRDDEMPGESWDEELVDPGQMVYIGQGQLMFLRINEVDPGMVWPKRRKAKKKKSSPPPSPPPAPVPAPIDWGDWEEICQFSPLPASPVPAPPATPWEPEEVPPPWQPEDWESEITPPWQPEDWESEITPPWQPEDWEAELSQ